MKVISNFKYVVLYNSELTASFNQAYYCSEYVSLHDAMNMIKSAWSSDTHGGKYYIALLQNDIYNPIIVATRKGNNIEVNMI